MLPQANLKSITAFIGAPCIAIDLFLQMQQGHKWTFTASTPLLTILFLIGWTCSIYAFIQNRAAGRTQLKQGLLLVQFYLLLATLVSYLLSLVTLYVIHFSDILWKVSHAMMLITGLSLAYAGRIFGWKKYSVALAGLWLPATMIIIFYLQQIWPGYFVAISSAFIWTLMAYTAFTHRRQTTRIRRKQTAPIQIETY